jgi:hypothetical protein
VRAMAMGQRKDGKWRGARADGSGTCKSTGSARWPALKRRRVCAAARSGRGPTACTQDPTSTPGSFQPWLEGRVHSKVKGVEGSPCASGRDSRTVVTSSRKGEAERYMAAVQHRSDVQAFHRAGRERGGRPVVVEERQRLGGVARQGNAPGPSVEVQPSPASCASLLHGSSPAAPGWASRRRRPGLLGAPRSQPPQRRSTLSPPFFFPLLPPFSGGGEIGGGNPHGQRGTGR